MKRTPTTLENLLAVLAPYAPEVMVDEESDGNIVLVLNLRLGADKATLEPFPDELDDQEDG